MTVRANLFTDHRMSGLPSDAHHIKAFQNNLRIKIDSYPTFLLALMIFATRCENFFSTDRCSGFTNSQYRSTYFCACPTMSWDHTITITCPFPLPESGNFSVAPAVESFSEVGKLCFLDDLLFRSSRVSRCCACLEIVEYVSSVRGLWATHGLPSF